MRVGGEAGGGDVGEVEVEVEVEGGGAGDFGEGGAPRASLNGVQLSLSGSAIGGREGGNESEGESESESENESGYEGKVGRVRG